jgi:hypothetical protein
MKSLSALIVSLFVSVPALASGPPSVRPLDGVAREAFFHGMRRSETFRELVAGLERDGLIVHVVTRRDLPTSLTGATRFVADIGGALYLRIELSASVPPGMRASVLGHELQHALEIASSGARSSAAVLALYKAGGKKASTIENGWETTAAEEVGRRIWIELHTRARSTALAED